MNTPSNHPADISVEVALALLQREGRVCRRRLWLCFGSLGMSLLTFIVAVGRRSYEDVGGLLLLLLSLCLLVLGALALPRSQSRALEALAARKDVRMIGPLVDALGIATGEKRKVVLALLTDLLPRIHASPAGVLNQAQCKRLCSELLLGDLEQEADFLATVLTALEWIGDKQALPYVERLASGDCGSAQERRVREAARACLPGLRARIERERVRQGLLRPVSEASPTELLRPAQAAQEADARQLLRTGASEEKLPGGQT